MPPHELNDFLQQLKLYSKVEQLLSAANVGTFHELTEECRSSSTRTRENERSAFKIQLKDDIIISFRYCLGRKIPNIFYQLDIH